MQTNLFEHKVYDGRKPKTLPHLEAILKEAPCMTCGYNLKSNDANCQPETCEKLTAWLIATGGN
jgi:hypothetical protein